MRPTPQIRPENEVHTQRTLLRGAARVVNEDPKTALAPFVMAGKVHREGERDLPPVSAEVSHGVSDGAHVSRFFDRLERAPGDARLQTKKADRSVNCPLSSRQMKKGKSFYWTSETESSFFMQP